jgi:hypothetical protein
MVVKESNTTTLLNIMLGTGVRVNQGGTLRMVVKEHKSTTTLNIMMGTRVRVNQGGILRMMVKERNFKTLLNLMLRTRVWVNQEGIPKMVVKECISTPLLNIEFEEQTILEIPYPVMFLSCIYFKGLMHDILICITVHLSIHFLLVDHCPLKYPFSTCRLSMQMLNLLYVFNS